MDRKEILLNAVLSIGSGGGGDEYEEVLLYENPDTSASMKGGTKVIDFGTRQDSLADYDYIKIYPWAGTEADSWRWFVVPSPKTVGNKNVECAINQNVSGTGQCVRIMTIYPPEAPVLSQANSIIAWAVFYTDGKITETAWAVPWKIYGIKKK